MNVSPDGMHATQRGANAEPPHPATDTFGQPIDEKGANDINNEFEDSFEDKHAWMVALIGEYEKTGKHGYSARMARLPSFPVFAECAIRCRLSFTMRTHNPRPRSNDHTPPICTNTPLTIKSRWFGKLFQTPTPTTS
jgi:hypothetical protein